jgi:hypothetical protein
MVLRKQPAGDESREPSKTGKREFEKMGKARKQDRVQSPDRSLARDNATPRLQPSRFGLAHWYLGKSRFPKTSVVYFVVANKR